MCLFICLYTFIVLSRCVPTIHQVCMRTHAAETKYFHCRFALRCKTEECDAPQNTGGAIHHHRLVNNSAKRCVIYRANKSNCDLYRKSNAAHTLTQKSNFPFVFAFFSRHSFILCTFQVILTFIRLLPLLLLLLSLPPHCLWCSKQFNDSLFDFVIQYM